MNCNIDEEITFLKIYGIFMYYCLLYEKFHIKIYRFYILIISIEIQTVELFDCGCLFLVKLSKKL